MAARQLLQKALTTHHYGRITSMHLKPCHNNSNNSWSQQLLSVQRRQISNTPLALGRWTYAYLSNVDKGLERRVFLPVQRLFMSVPYLVLQAFTLALEYLVHSNHDDDDVTITLQRLAKYPRSSAVHHQLGVFDSWTFNHLGCLVSQYVPRSNRRRRMHSNPLCI